MKAKGRPALLKREKEDGSLATMAVAVVTVIVLLIVLAGIWFRGNYVTYEIVGPSMEHTLSSGDWVYARPGDKAERGDIVIVDVKGDTRFHGDDAIIKRLIALGGDTVECHGGVVYVKHAGGAFEPLDEGYAYGETKDFGPVTVQAGYAFVMGDNREESYDSRAVGAFSYDEIIAVVPQWSVSWKGSVAAWEMFRKDVRSFFAKLF